MVVPQPLSGQQMRGRGRDQRIHVHFFDEPPTRGWVSTKYIREYQGCKKLALCLMLITSKYCPNRLPKLDVTSCVSYSAGSDSSSTKPGGVFFCGKPVIQQAMKLADEAMSDSPEKRLKMPVCMDLSDEEDEEEEMEVKYLTYLLIVTKH